MKFFEIPLEYYFVSWIGAFVLYFRLKSTGRSIIRLLPHINNKWKDLPWVNFLDALIISLLGAVIGTIITEPSSPQQAITTGLGWTGLLSILESS